MSRFARTAHDEERSGDSGYPRTTARLGQARRIGQRILAAALVLAITVPALAWGREGHRMVALVATNHLTPTAQANVKFLLGTETMAGVASFADDYRSTHRETAPWHYADIPINEKTYLRERDCPLPAGAPADPAGQVRDCVVERIPFFLARLQNAELSKDDRAFALKMLIHLVGDVHQPLHAIGEARGGNSIAVTEFGTKQCGERQLCNLHATWDEGLIAHRHLGEVKYVAHLEQEITELKLADKPLGTPIAWANASHRAAVEAWIPNGSVIGDEYFKDEIPVVDRELEFGGLHLAALLNQAFTTLPPGAEIAPKREGAPVLIPRQGPVVPQ